MPTYNAVRASRKRPRCPSSKRPPRLPEVQSQGAPITLIVFVQTSRKSGLGMRTSSSGPGLQRLFSGVLNESAMLLIKWSRRWIDPVGSCGGLGRPDSAGTSLRYPFSRDRTNSRTTQEKA